MRIIVLCTLVSCSVLGASGIGNPGNRFPTRPKLQRVQIYVDDGLSMSRINVNLSSGKIGMIYKDYESRPQSWKGVEASLTSDESRRVSLLAQSSDLRRFHPQSKWFVGTMPPPDSGSTLAIVWTNRTVSFAIPPQNMRTKLSSTAKQRYKEIDKIVNLLIDLRNAHLESAPRRQLASSSSEVRAYRADHEVVSRSSQPRDRIGW
jgi:hypothetical protein